MTARSFIILLLALLGLTACGAEDDDYHDDDVTSAVGAEPLMSAASHGLNLMLPFPADAQLVLTRAYNTGTHVRHGAYEWDDTYAVDLAGPGCGGGWGTPVYAAAAGTVVTYPVPGSPAERSRLEASYGDAMVVIDHGNGCFSHYGHLDANTVRVGQRVQQGEQIGRMGNKGHVESSCQKSTTPHWGAHLHFKVVCDGAAVVPEPLSGYVNLPGKVGKWLTHESLQHPAGTLVKSASSADIYLVSERGQLRHVRDETVWRSYRFWQDQSREWDTVVTVSDDELACHNRGLDLDRPVRLEATTCLSGASGAPAWSTYVTFDDGISKWRRRVPFAASAPEYAIMLRSWGFRVADVSVNGQTCAIAPAADDRLPLRDGSVIETPSDTDFYVVTEGGTARRLYRNLMPVLYGAGWPQVMQVPEGSVPSLVLKVDASHREFTVTDAATCFNGSRVLQPGSGDGTGGGETDGPEIGPGDSSDPPAPVPVPTTVPADCPADSCEVGERRCYDWFTPIRCVASFKGCGYYELDFCGTGTACDDATASCQPTSPAPAPVPNPTSVDPPHTLRCTASASALKVSVTGPVLDALVAKATQPSALYFGSDQNGWSTSASSARLATWEGERSYELSLPANTDGFNLYVADASTAARDSWFDLGDANGDGVRWNVVGDCKVSGTKIVRGSGATTPAPAPLPAPMPQPSSDGAEITCTATSAGLQVAVADFDTDVLVNAPANTVIRFISAGGDGGLSWSPSASAQPQTPCDPSAASCMLMLPVATTRFNLWAQSTGGQAYWFDLSRWLATGDCSIEDDGLGGRVLLRR